ncbi:MAG: peptide deformylase [Acidobacteriota bacterium]|nr:peptide deformylase [Acidobacteriota bacterium]NLT33942.1 peptide deformylase [Acidobacteriota bacterium]
MIMKILKYGAPELRVQSERVTSFDDELKKIVVDMFETMYSSPGIGLAAPQVGINLQLSTIDLSVGADEGKRIVLCNPEIVSSEGSQRGDEGCLSIPDFSESVTRPLKVVVRGQGIDGEELRIEAEGLLARCLCHEIDHLNGILFIDHLSSLKRTLIKNRIRKLVKAGDW